MSLETWASNRWLENLGSDRDEVERLLANADGHLGEDGAGLVGAIEGLGSQSLFCHQAGVDQLAQLPLHGPQCNPRHPGKLS